MLRRRFSFDSPLSPAELVESFRRLRKTWRPADRPFEVQGLAFPYLTVKARSDRVKIGFSDSPPGTIPMLASARVRSRPEGGSTITGVVRRRRFMWFAHAGLAGMAVFFPDMLGPDATVTVTGARVFLLGLLAAWAAFDRAVLVASSQAYVESLVELIERIAREGYAGASARTHPSP